MIKNNVKTQEVIHTDFESVSAVAFVVNTVNTSLSPR